MDGIGFHNNTYGCNDMWFDAISYYMPTGHMSGVGGQSNMLEGHWGWVGRHINMLGGHMDGDE